MTTFVIIFIVDGILIGGGAGPLGLPGYAYARELGMLLCNEEKVAAIEFICGLAETFSSCELLTVDSSKVHRDCVLYSAKDEFYAMLFLWKNIANISSISWWNSYCTNHELSKSAGRL